MFTILFTGGVSGGSAARESIASSNVKLSLAAGLRLLLAIVHALQLLCDALVGGIGNPMAHQIGPARPERAMNGNGSTSRVNKNGHTDENLRRRVCRAAGAVSRHCPSGTHPDSRGYNKVGAYEMDRCCCGEKLSGSRGRRWEEVNCSYCTLIIDWIRNKELVKSWLSNFGHNATKHMCGRFEQLSWRRGKLLKDLFGCERRWPLLLMNILLIWVMVILLSSLRILSNEDRGGVHELLASEEGSHLVISKYDHSLIR